MRAIVVSDTHGNFRNLLKVFERHSDSELFVFLGDGESDYRRLISRNPTMRYVLVRGNCDFGTEANLTEIIDFGEKRILCTHGHAFSVKRGLGGLIASSKEQNADVCLFGHTHVPCSFYDDGLYVMNPGSLSNGVDGGCSYGILDITEAGVAAFTVKLT
ncbi:MAG: metallophosphoesterase [Oscillospiraceae bacterium]|nr:metallophosphoesterase [Oscillospiraceae bacterium]